jgi:hypothetical protein
MAFTLGNGQWQSFVDGYGAMNDTVLHGARTHPRLRSTGSSPNRSLASHASLRHPLRNLEAGDKGAFASGCVRVGGCWFCLGRLRAYVTIIDRSKIPNPYIAHPFLPPPYPGQHAAPGQRLAGIMPNEESGGSFENWCGFGGRERLSSRTHTPQRRGPARFCLLS